MSLIVEKTGLKLGDGLYFAPGLGGDGLVIPPEQFDNVRFGGAGGMSVSAVLHASAGARFAGAGALQATPS